MHDAKPEELFETHLKKTHLKRMLNRLRCIVNLNNS